VPSLGFLAALFALLIAITISIASEPQTESLRTPLARMLPRVIDAGDPDLLSAVGPIATIPRLSSFVREVPIAEIVPVRK
jgi:hypothetical protein